MIQQEINLVVLNKNLAGNEDLIFRLYDGEEDIEYISEDLDMYDVLVKFNLFSSRSDAKRTWKRSGQKIPEGFSDFPRIGKYKVNLYIWNPTSSLNTEVMKICRDCKKTYCDGCEYERQY